MDLKTIISKVPLLKRSIVKMLSWRNKRIRAENYRKYGEEALKRFADCMDRNGIEYTLAFGSILGAIREHGFIKHDIDIDTYIWYDNYSSDIAKCLINDGFIWRSTYEVDGGKSGKEDTFIYKGVSIDIFYLYPPINTYPYSCLFIWLEGMNKEERMPRRVELPVSRERKKVQFENIEVYIPSNSEQICKLRYGSDFMTPNPNWNWRTESQSIVDWKDKISNTKHINYPQI